MPVVAEREEAAQVVRALVRSRELRDRTVHLAQRRIWHEHTYTHRARQVLDAVGLGGKAGSTGLSGGAGLPAVSVLAATNRPEQLDHLVDQVARQTGVERQLLLVTHGFEPPTETAQRARELGIENVVVLEAPRSWSLGACLNAAVERADGGVCAKMDDDDLYGAFYLHDLLRAREFSGAQVVGKHAHYMHLDGTDATLLRFPWMEHRFTDRVMGPTSPRAATCSRPIPSRTGTAGRTPRSWRPWCGPTGRSTPRTASTSRRCAAARRAGTPGRPATASCWPRRMSPGSAGTTATCRCDPEPLADGGGGGARRRPPDGDRSSDVPLVEGRPGRSDARVRWPHAGAESETLFIPGYEEAPGGFVLSDPADAQGVSTSVELTYDEAAPRITSQAGLSFDARELANPMWGSTESNLALTLEELDSPALRFGGNGIDRHVWWTSSGEPAPEQRP